jgi:predicted patatin/cPLA2 family phospholipase
LPATPSVLPPAALDVREVILRRAAEGSRPGSRRDAHRVALCVEGGGMRGVVSAGMVIALEHLGLLDVFDAVYGSSAGAINGAFFVAGQAAFGTSIYYEEINNKRFIDLGRAWGPRPVLDLDLLVWNVMRDTKRLDVPRVLGSPIRFHALATDTTSASRTVFRSWTSEEDFLGSLRAGATMPIVAGEPYPFRGRTYWDALLTEPIPVRVAEEDGYTHLMVLLTRPAGGAPRLSFTDRMFIIPRLRRVSEPLARRYTERARQYVALLHALESGRGPQQRAAVLTAAPARAVAGKLERDRGRLLGAARAGMSAVVTSLGLESHLLQRMAAPLGVALERRTPASP